MLKRHQTSSPALVARLRRYDVGLRDRLGRGCDAAVGSRELARRAELVGESHLAQPLRIAA